MGLIKSIPTDRGVPGVYWRAINFTLGTRNAQAPTCVIEWAGYASADAYLAGSKPLAEYTERIPTQQLIEILTLKADTFAEVASSIDGWVAEYMHATSVSVENPTFDPESEEGDTNPRFVTERQPGPWSDALAV